MSKQESPQFRQTGKNSSTRLAWLIVGCGTIFSILLISILYTFGKSETSVKERKPNIEVIDLLQTPRANDVEVADISSAEVGIVLPQGGWVRQTDGAGNLVQQYRCKSLDPNPASLPTGWIEMQNPEVELYLSDNRKVRITGDFGIANAPKRILESGEIAGHVTVEMFSLPAGDTDTLHLEPTMVLTTTQVSFDNFIGEITCDGVVRITSPTQTLVGRRLTVRFNDLEDRIEYLRLDELDYIDIYPSRANAPIQPKSIATIQPSEPTRSNKDADQASPNKTNRHVQASTIGPDIAYYIVTLEENVAILQGDQLTGRLAFGDSLTIAFSKQSTSSKPIDITSVPLPSAMVYMGMPTAFAVSSLATVQTSQPTDAPQQKPVRITCDHGLTMVPLEDTSLMPSVPEETRIELKATTGSLVELIDNTQGLKAVGDVLRFEVLQERTDLFGSPATLQLNDMLTTAKHLWIASEDGEGGVVGSGTIVGTQQATSNTTLTWEEGVDFSFASSDGVSKGDLDQVTCHGNVKLVNDDSMINCDKLDVHFKKSQDGTSNPSLAIATGNVKATSSTQVLWANETQVSFKQGSTDSQDTTGLFGGSRADQMSATGNVQVLLNDGGRAFCDQLDGDVSQESALLHGNVVIAYNKMLMNRGETATLTLNRTTGKGIWKGAGQALFLEEPLDVSPDRRIKRPRVDPSKDIASDIGVITMRANWGEEMHLDQQFNDGAGAIDLSGQVEIRSQRSSSDRGQMTGEDLRLEFTFIDSLLNTKTTDTAHGEVAKNKVTSQRELQKVIARNNAQIEHRLFDALHPENKPIVYYIGGNHIEFNPITQEALAVGKGELLLRDPRQPEISTHQSALAGRGTTLFRWDRKLHTTSLAGSLYRIEMNGNVQMLHMGLDNSVGKLTADSLEAIAEDPQAKLEREAGVSQRAFRGGGDQFRGQGEPFRGGVTLRGMDLQQLMAKGNVYVETNARSVNCDVFDYNLSTGFAKLLANENSTISITTRGTPYPVLATSIIWNMDPTIDTISIRGLQGTSSQ